MCMREWVREGCCSSRVCVRAHGGLALVLAWNVGDGILCVAWGLYIFCVGICCWGHGCCGCKYCRHRCGCRCWCGCGCSVQWAQVWVRVWVQLWAQVLCARVWVQCRWGAGVGMQVWVQV